jgi:hypothetical protein
MHKGGIRCDVAAQQAELARLDAISRERLLSRAETDRLAELVRRERIRNYFRSRRLAEHLARAEARLADLRAAQPLAVAA